MCVIFHSAELGIWAACMASWWAVVGQWPAGKASLLPSVRAQLGFVSPRSEGLMWEPPEESESGHL